MGVFDTIKDKVTQLVGGQGDKVADGLDNAGDIVDEKTGGSHSEQIDQGVDKGKDALDGPDGKDDDIS